MLTLGRQPTPTSAPPGSVDPARHPWHALEPAAIEAQLDTTPHGLTRDAATARLQRYGPNQLEEAPPPSVLALLLHQFRSPLIYILLVATVVTLLLEEYIDAGVIAAVLLLNAVIGFTQERQAEFSVRALMRLVSPHARVIREGHEWDIESRDLVPGDLVLLESGVRVPADLRLISTTGLLIDESLLTGESLPVTKQTTRVAERAILADRVCMAYAGTTVTSGRGRGYVVATGASTELGAIATQIRSDEQGQTPLQQRMSRFAVVISLVIAAASVLAFIVGLARGESVGHMFMVVVAMAVAAIPEGLPIAFTITLAVGVRRMARRNAIVRRLPAVETLGSTTTIGSDKTGTLTENRMVVQRIWSVNHTLRLDDAGEPAPLTIDGIEVRDPLHLTVLAGVLANEAKIALTPGGIQSWGDPTEAALLVAATRVALEPEDLRDAWRPFAEIPFEPERQYSATIREHAGRHVLFVKGAPERVLAMSTRIQTPDGPAALDPQLVHDAARELASAGLRVLGMAWRELPVRLTTPEQVSDPEGLTFLGLTGMMDPPRAGVREAVAGCQAAGIRVVMITGDHAITAGVIAQQLGISTSNEPAITGAELELLDDEALRERIEHISVFARVAPEQKLRVVRALQERGHVVAVTGDGVNDAPALKAADIGVAMGRGGTDVAREASDMVLADDNFASIYAAVEEGRITFDNVRKVTFFLISTGAASIIVILAALAFGWPIPFVAAQLLWLNLVTNGLQDVALAFEPGERGVTQRPPRARSEGVISRLLWERTAIAGLVMAAGTLALFHWELERGSSLVQAQTVALTTLVVFQMFHVGNARSERRSVFRLSPFSNPFLFAATAAAFIVHVAALYLRPTQFVLRVEPIDADAWLRILLVAATILLAVEAHKLLRRDSARERGSVSAA
jgi:calcium-translocating P-type ATPase